MKGTFLALVLALLGTAIPAQAVELKSVFEVKYGDYGWFNYLERSTRDEEKDKRLQETFDQFPQLLELQKQFDSYVAQESQSLQDRIAALLPNEKVQSIEILHYFVAEIKHGGRWGSFLGYKLEVKTDKATYSYEIDPFDIIDYHMDVYYEGARSLEAKVTASPDRSLQVYNLPWSQEKIKKGFDTLIDTLECAKSEPSQRPERIKTVCNTDHPWGNQK